MGVHSGVNRDACSLNFKTFVLGVYSGFQRAFLGFWDLLRGLCLPGKPKKKIDPLKISADAQVYVWFDLAHFQTFVIKPLASLVWFTTRTFYHLNGSLQKFVTVKKGKKEITSYRPISNICSYSKVFEQAMKSLQMMAENGFWTEKKYIDGSAGFRRWSPVFEWISWQKCLCAGSTIWLK